MGETQEPARVAAKGEFVGRSCPYCRFPFKEGEQIAVCGDCRASHHGDCWNDNGGCAVLGCNSAPAKPHSSDDGLPHVQPTAKIVVGLGDEVENPVGQGRRATDRAHLSPPPGSGTSAMTRAIVVLAIVVAAGVTAVLLLGKGAKAPAAPAAAKPVSHATAPSPATVTVTTAVTISTSVVTRPAPVSTRRAPVSKTTNGFAVSSGPDYTVDYPRTWSVTEDNAPQSYNSTATASKFVEQSGSGAYILVAETADSSTSAKFDAMQQRNFSVGEAGYDELSLGPVRTSAGTGWQWEFQQGGNQKVDTFWHACGHGFAVLGSAPTGLWSSYERTFVRVTNSFKTDPC